MTPTCVLATLIAVEIKAPSWLVVFFAVTAGLMVSIFMYSYLFCLHNDRGALRSEHHAILSFAIRKSWRGDSISGLLSAEATGALSSDQKPPALTMDQKP
jgi:hypothetical protein